MQLVNDVINYMKTIEPISNQGKTYRYKSDLKEGQLFAVDQLIKHKRYALWLPMGFGKTIITLTAFAELKRLGLVKRALIVSTAFVSREVWHEEIDSWEHLKHLSYKVLSGESIKVRRKLLTTDKSDIHIISVNTLNWLTNELKLPPTRRVGMIANGFPYDLLVLDESSLYKDMSTKRFKSAFYISSRAERVIELTGTPTSGEYQNLVGQIKLLDGGETLGSSYTAHYQKLGIKTIQLNPFLKKPVYTAENMAKMDELIKPFVLHMKSDVVIDNENVYYYDDLTQKVTDQLETFRNTGVLLSDEGLPMAVSESCSHTTQKLLQLTQGFSYPPDTYNVKIPHFEIHTKKIELLNKVLNDIGDENVIIVYAYKHTCELLLRSLPGSISFKDEPDAVNKWNNGALKYLLMHPKSAGHGLNLQKGGRHIVWYTLPFSLEEYQQTNARLIRRGQQGKVFIHHILMRNTIDEVILKLLNKRAALQEDTLNSNLKLNKDLLNELNDIIQPQYASAQQLQSLKAYVTNHK